MVLQKLKIVLKNFWHSCHTISFSTGTSFAKKTFIFIYFAKIADISKIKGVLVLKGMFFEIKIFPGY